MKAEHRHELKTNALADMLGRAVHAIKTGPSRHGLLILGVAVVIVVVAGTVYFLWKGQKESRSAAWVEVDDDQRQLAYAVDGDGVTEALEKFKKTADSHPGTVQGRTARFDRARTLLHRGLERLATPEREQAVKDITEARGLYAKLAEEPAGKDNDPNLTQEALLSVATADESLGEWDDAIKGYRKLAEMADKYPNSFLVKAAAERAQYLDNEDNRKKVAALYDKLKQETKTPAPVESPEKKP